MTVEEEEQEDFRGWQQQPSQQLGETEEKDDDDEDVLRFKIYAEDDADNPIIKKTAGAAWKEMQKRFRLEGVPGALSGLAMYGLNDLRVLTKFSEMLRCAVLEQQLEGAKQLFDLLERCRERKVEALQETSEEQQKAEERKRRKEQKKAEKKEWKKRRQKITTGRKSGAAKKSGGVSAAGVVKEEPISSTPGSSANSREKVPHDEEGIKLEKKLAVIPQIPVLSNEAQKVKKKQKKNESDSQSDDDEDITLQELYQQDNRTTVKQLCQQQRIGGDQRDCGQNSPMTKTSPPSKNNAAGVVTTDHKNQQEGNQQQKSPPRPKLSQPKLPGRSSTPSYSDSDSCSSSDASSSDPSSSSESSCPSEPPRQRQKVERSRPSPAPKTPSKKDGGKNKAMNDASPSAAKKSMSAAGGSAGGTEKTHVGGSSILLHNPQSTPSAPLNPASSASKSIPNLTPKAPAHASYHMKMPLKVPMPKPNNNNNMEFKLTSTKLNLGGGGSSRESAVIPSSADQQPRPSTTPKSSTALQSTTTTNSSKNTTSQMSPSKQQSPNTTTTSVSSSPQKKSSLLVGGPKNEGRVSTTTKPQQHSTPRPSLAESRSAQSPSSIAFQQAKKAEDEKRRIQYEEKMRSKKCTIDDMASSCRSTTPAVAIQKEISAAGGNNSSTRPQHNNLTNPVTDPQKCHLTIEVLTGSLKKTGEDLCPKCRGFVYDHQSNFSRKSATESGSSEPRPPPIAVQPSPQLPPPPFASFPFPLPTGGLPMPPFVPPEMQALASQLFQPNPQMGRQAQYPILPLSYPPPSAILASPQQTSSPKAPPTHFFPSYGTSPKVPAIASPSFHLPPSGPFNRLLYKTKFCVHHIKSGNCAMGDRCTYAHSRAELRASEKCDYYSAGGRGCRFGEMCEKAHSDDEFCTLQPPIDPPKED